MPDLTMTACPSCGLPAEIIYRFSRDLGAGPVEHARTRCILLHFSSIPIVDLQASAGEPAAVDLVTSPVRPAGQVLSFPTARPGMSLAGRLSDWSRHLVWAAFGALAAVLLLRAPQAIVLLPLIVLVFTIAAARRCWRPIAPPSGPVPLAVPIQRDTPGREAA